MEQTRLQKIIEQKTEQIRDAIEQAIKEGAKIEHSIYVGNGYLIDGIFVQKCPIDRFTICLNIKSEIIAAACEPSKDELEKIAKQKRAELEEIEKQIKERE
jgi:hypothetical protein